jgi:alkanesulfonate monooxygenase SsuD/methylene tetrahydromethanopterin reductase-like flavin-dependent oxidoreductase (luciferase family)
MEQTIRLGFLTHVEGAGDPARIYQDTLDLIVAADQLGFDVVWVAQHHFKDLVGRLPSLFPFFAAAAERTRRIRLGAAVVVLPLEHPLRVAEDAAVVDLLSGGRLELGIGSGSDAGEFAAFGVDIAQRHALTTRGLQTLQQALCGESIGDSGQRLQPPAPTLAERLWQSALSVQGAQYAAQHGVGLLLSRAAWGSDEPTDVAQVPVAKAYQAAWQDRHVKPRLGLSRGVFPAADKRSALAGLREGVMRTAAGQQRQNNLPAGQSLEYYCERLHIAYGHPEEVAAGLLADRVAPYATDLILQFSPAITPLVQAILMLVQIATEVAPALGWRLGR